MLIKKEIINKLDGFDENFKMYFEDVDLCHRASKMSSFCYVSDIANAFQSVLETANGEIINVGNDSEPISIKELAEKIISLTNSQSEIKFIPFKESDRNRTEIMSPRVLDL